MVPFPALIGFALQVATHGVKIVTLVRRIYNVDESLAELSGALAWYEQRLQERRRFFGDLQRELENRRLPVNGDAGNGTVDMDRAYEEVRLLVWEARGALGRVQGIRDDIGDLTLSGSRIKQKVKTYFTLDGKSTLLKDAREEFDKRLYDLDMGMLRMGVRM